MRYTTQETLDLIEYRRNNTFNPDQIYISEGIERFCTRHKFKNANSAGLSTNTINAIKLSGGVSHKTLMKLAIAAGIKPKKGDDPETIGDKALRDFRSF